jgi:hypothetical protein
MEDRPCDENTRKAGDLTADWLISETHTVATNGMRRPRERGLYQLVQH